MLISTVATRHNNATHGEDNYLVRGLGGDTLLDAVMDGVTGRGGGQASRALADALATATLRSPDEVVAVLADVNRQLYQRGGGHFLLTTVSVSLFLDGQLYVVSAGDSPVFLIRSESYQHLSSSVRGVLHRGPTSAIGASQQLEHLYRAEVTIEPGDRLLLATDGITDNISSRELVEIVRRAASPDEAAERISTLMAIRLEGWLTESLGGSFRRDDWTAIVRFFNAPSGKDGGAESGTDPS